MVIRNGYKMKWGIKMKMFIKWYLYINGLWSTYWSENSCIVEWIRMYE